MLSVPPQRKEKGELFGFFGQLAKIWQGSDEAWDLQSEQWAIRVVHGPL